MKASESEFASSTYEAVAQPTCATVDADEMDWHAYAEHYDEMCALNPAYHENIGMLLERLQSWNLPPDARICDLGGGTGNYILAMHQNFPSARYHHVDVDDRMIEFARRKYSEAKVENVEILTSNVHSVDFASEFFDVVVCVNALYAFTSQEAILSRVHSWLKPTGKLFLIDFGRKQNTLDWTVYMFIESLKSRQLGRYARALIGAREVLRQNRRTTLGQESGRYWLHSTDELGEALERAGFVVAELSSCYRQYCDFAVCSK